MGVSRSTGGSVCRDNNDDISHGRATIGYSDLPIATQLSTYECWKDGGINPVGTTDASHIDIIVLLYKSCSKSCFQQHKLRSPRHASVLLARYGIATLFLQPNQLCLIIVIFINCKRHKLVSCFEYIKLLCFPIVSKQSLFIV
jgi:hypothetical protein